LELPPPPPSSVFSLLFTPKHHNATSQSLRPTPFRRSPHLTTSRRYLSAASTIAAQDTQNYEDASKIPPDDRIPATIITGFLGSGKTTLLNHILTADHGKRIAVIENEFGEVDIDGSLVAAKTTGAEDIVMLNNGCLCCTVRGDLVRMIAELVSKKRGKFDHIVIETTRLANPAPIIQTFYAEDQVFNDVKLDGVVTLTDLVGEPDVTSLIQRIRNINRMANLTRTAYGNVDLDYVLGIGGFDLERFHLIETAISTESSKDEDVSHGQNHDHHHEHDHHHHRDEKHDHDHHHHDHHAHDHTHDPGVSSAAFEDIYRMKGLMCVEGMDERFVFQGVHDIFQSSPDRLWGPDEARMNKIVFIGKNLDAQELEKGFKSCLL
uniref:CobW C-terminal domain-containing protein n=1 Tax=Kalanchoe fedtschenkoi TaxID=63787 RepID=A0A7N0ZU17_KALFE